MYLEKIPAIAAKYDVGVFPLSKLINYEVIKKGFSRGMLTFFVCDPGDVAPMTTTESI